MPAAVQLTVVVVGLLVLIVVLAIPLRLFFLFREDDPGEPTGEDTP